MTNRKAPPLSYYGSKAGVASRIVDKLPPHRHYVEPFAGSLAVLLAKPASVMETVNDLDEALMTFWRVLRDQPEKLARACALTPHSRGEFVAAAKPAVDDVETARRVFVQLTQSRSGTRRNVGWRHYVAAGDSATGMPKYLDGYVSRLYNAAERLRHVSLESRPALELITTYGAAHDVCLYVDPPYLGSTRARNYAHEMTSDTDHHELAKALNDCEAAVVLSGYDSPLYRDLYRHWHRHDFATTASNSHNRDRVETLWTNRETTPALFDVTADIQ